MFKYPKELLFVFLLIFGLSWESKLSAIDDRPVKSDPGIAKMVSAHLYSNREPFAVLSASSLQNLLTQALKVSDNIYPQSSSILSMLAVSFLGSMQCPGLSEKIPCFLALHYYQNTYNPVFAFHATKSCPLVRNLSLAGATSTNGLLIPFQNASTQTTWYLYGSKDLLKLIAKDITSLAPYLSKKVTPSTDLLNLTTKLTSCDFLTATLPPYLQAIYNTFLKDAIDSLSCSVNVENNDFVCKIKVNPSPSSPLVALIRALESSKKQHKFLKMEAEDDIQICGFQAFNALKTCLESFAAKTQESLWKNDPTAYQMYLWGKCLYPLFTQLLEFSNDYFSGNYQCYQNLKREKNLILLQNVGLVELKVSKKANEALVNFLETFIKQTLQTQFLSAIQQKLVGSEHLRTLNLRLDKAIVKDKNYTIHGLSCGINNENMCLNYPFVFSVYKNHFLYSDNLEDLQALIHRLEKNKWTYERLPWVQKSFINLGQILQKSGYFKAGVPLISKSNSSFEITYTTQSKPDSITVEIKIPLTFDNMFAYLQQIPFPQQQSNLNKQSVGSQSH